MHRITLLVFSLFVFSPAISARTVADIDVPETVTQTGQAGELLLNGAGIRKKFFINIYVAGLYLVKKTSDVGTIASMESANRISMHFVYSEVSKKKMDDAWQQGFEDNNPAGELARLLDRLKQFQALFRDMHKGDQVWIDYLPGKGTFVSINGEETGHIPGRDFNTALLRVWLGPNPVTDDLKSGLLGLD